MKLLFSIFLLGVCCNFCFAQTKTEQASQSDKIKSITNLDWQNSKSTFKSDTANLHYSPNPLVVLYFKNKMIIMDRLPAELERDFIKELNILKGKAASKKYGTIANDGVVEVVLKEEKCPNAYKLFKSKSGWKKVSEKDIPKDLEVVFH